MDNKIKEQTTVKEEIYFTVVCSLIYARFILNRQIILYVTKSCPY